MHNFFYKYNKFTKNINFNSYFTLIILYYSYLNYRFYITLYDNLINVNKFLIIFI